MVRGTPKLSWRSLRRICTRPPPTREFTVHARLMLLLLARGWADVLLATLATLARWNVNDHLTTPLHSPSLLPPPLAESMMAGAAADATDQVEGLALDFGG